MNRYVRDGLVRDARDYGRKVLVVARPIILHLLYDGITTRSDTEDVTYLCRANGREEVRFASGGSIVFRRPGASVRGYSPDVLVVDHAVVESFDLVPIAAAAEVVKV